MKVKAQINTFVTEYIELLLPYFDAINKTVLNKLIIFYSNEYFSKNNKNDDDFQS